MFSGLIAYLGTVASLDRDPRGGVRMRVEAPAAVADGVEPKDSIAISGVCLTVTEHDASSVTFDVVPETLDRSALGALVVGAPVNVELSLRLGDRLGGHLVYGHVDATARILAKVPEGQGHRLTSRPRKRSRRTSSIRVTSRSTASASPSRRRASVNSRSRSFPRRPHARRSAAKARAIASSGDRPDRSLRARRRRAIRRPRFERRTRMGVRDLVRRRYRGRTRR